MKISFPYMGCVTGYKKLFELLGHEVIMPEQPKKSTIDLGVLYSPEFICFPFKAIMGTYIEVCKSGAELIITSGGSGPCRAGMYCEVHKKILQGLGYNVDVICFDSMFEDFKEFLRKLKLIKNKTPFFKLLRHILFCYKMIDRLDKLEKELKIRRAYEINKDDFNKAFEKMKQMFLAANTFKEQKQVNKEAWELMDSIPVRNIEESERVRMGIVGEIYVVMEKSVNMDVEQRLNSMGVEVYNVQYISDWIRHNILPRKINKAHSWKMWDKAERYKGCNCGGHDMENTGCIIDFAERGFDGVVHLLPFGCLPELVTRSIIPKMSEELDIPILTMSLDEQQGEANTQTRIEAFVDLCKNRKNNKSKNAYEKSIGANGKVVNV